MQERSVQREDGATDLYPDYQDGQFVIERHPSVENRWVVFEKRLDKGVWGRKEITRKEGLYTIDDAKEWIKGRSNLPADLLVESEIDGQRQCVVRARPAVVKAAT
jgi:hypothetical protein